VCVQGTADGAAADASNTTPAAKQPDKRAQQSHRTQAAAGPAPHFSLELEGGGRVGLESPGAAWVRAVRWRSANGLVQQLGSADVPHGRDDKARSHPPHHHLGVAGHHDAVRCVPGGSAGCAGSCNSAGRGIGPDRRLQQARGGQEGISKGPCMVPVKRHVWRLSSNATNNDYDACPSPSTPWAQSLHAGASCLHRQPAGGGSMHHGGSSMQGPLWV